ncbi:MAG: RsmB/NOP family class I SAM-dependent RNA methyltransferase [Acetivibrionales bacterium]
MKLPDAFIEKMEKLLGQSEYEELAEAILNGQRQHGLYVNKLKVSVEKFMKLSPFRLEPVPWAVGGFYISGEDMPGRHAYYHAGLYYIQEPSAMLPAQALGVKPGEKVLDLCAAPGGKSVQIASAMQGQGLLFSNDISADRVKALVKNMELCGVRNVVVLNEEPEKLALRLGGYFDRVLVDAPCSGEGMFRKDETAARSWERFGPEHCARLQERIMNCAHRLLKPGGTLVYSTCTFSPEENEMIIFRFMKNHGGYELVDMPKTGGIEGGRPQWVKERENKTLPAAGLDAYRNGNSPDVWADAPGFAGRMARLWPHRLRGEGHFIAKLVKEGTSHATIFDGDGEATRHKEVIQYEEVTPYEKLPESFRVFVEENLNAIPDGVYLLKGKNLYQLPEPPPLLDGLKTAKFGWFLGTFEKGRFEPSHSMVTALGRSIFKRTADLDAGSREVKSYLKGETLMLEGEKGLTAVCVDGFTLGWAKQTGSMLKNMYPKGWRRLK